MFILDRETGEPVYGVEEQPVPAGDVPGEHYSPTQPIPVKPPPLARTSIDRGDIVTAADTNAQHAAACRERWDTVGYYNDGPYTPLRLRADGTPPSLVLPGSGGGVNWGGDRLRPRARLYPREHQGSRRATHGLDAGEPGVWTEHGETKCRISV